MASNEPCHNSEVIYIDICFPSSICHSIRYARATWVTHHGTHYPASGCREFQHAHGGGRDVGSGPPRIIVFLILNNRKGVLCPRLETKGLACPLTLSSLQWLSIKQYRVRWVNDCRFMALNSAANLFIKNILWTRKGNAGEVFLFWQSYVLGAARCWQVFVDGLFLVKEYFIASVSVTSYLYYLFC